MKTALVTGGTGFIGHYLANELHRRGYKVTVIDKAYNFCDYLLKGVNFILQDIRSSDKVGGDYNYVYHLAEKRSVLESFDLPEEYITTNSWGTYNIIHSFYKSRVINVSSSAASGIKSPYGITKRSSEHTTNLHKNSINARIMNVFGERQQDLSISIPAFMHAIKHNKTATIYGDGNILRDYTYIHDLVDELITLGESKRKGTTEIGYGTPIKIIDLFRLLSKASKKRSKLDFEAGRKGDMKKTCCKYPIKEPHYGFNEGIRRTIRWYLKNKEF